MAQAMVATSFGETITVAALAADPYPIYRRLRDEEPVSWVPAVGLWLVTRWDDVRAVALDHETFTSETDPSTLTRTLGRNMLASDGAYHRRLRAVFEPPFRRRSLDAFVQQTLPALAGDLVEQFAPHGAVELVSQLAEPLAVRTLQLLLGLGELPEERLQRWYDGFCIGAANFERDPDKQETADRACREFDAAVAPIVERVSRAPDGSVLSALVHARADGSCLVLTEILANLKLLFIGGMQEPRDLIALTTWALLSHPEQAAAVRATPALLKPAIEETLRCYAPVATATRQVRRPTTLAGVTLERGALVAAVLASANRDERHWHDPERFDLYRKEGPHLAFAAGPHFCLGAWLARQMATVAVGILFARLPTLRLDPAAPAVAHGWEFRGLRHLHLRWDV